MSVENQIIALVYMMVQSVSFFAGALVVLMTPLDSMAMQLFPFVIGGAMLLSLPVSDAIAQRMRARAWRRRDVRSDVISG